MSPVSAMRVVIRGHATGRERTLDPLPGAWLWVTVGDVADVFRGASPRPKGDPRYFGGPIPWIMISDLSRQPGKYLYKTSEGVTEAGAALSRRLRDGTLILSNSGTVCVPKILKTEGCIHDGFVSFTGLERCVSLDFAYWWFEFVRPYIVQENRQGVTQVNLNTDIVRDIHIPIPPRPEQDRIVDEIEKQITRLDSAVEALKTVKANLKRYRASVLKAACEGRLVPTEAELALREGRSYEPASELLKRILAERRARWEADQLAKFRAAGKEPRDEKWKARYKEPTVPDGSVAPVLLEGWKWYSLAMLTVSGPQNGLYLPQSAYGSGMPILRIDDFQDGWSRGSDELRRVEPTSSDAECFALAERDLVINRVNSPSHLGKVLLVGKKNLPALFESNMMRMHLSTELNAHFVVYYLQSLEGRRRLIERAKWAVNQASINQTDVGLTLVPLPPPAEQSRIVAEVERRLSVIDELETTVEGNLKRADRLRQAVLKHAFDGKLVPQDPDDEPASVLLERIKAVRSTDNGVRSE